MDTLTGMLTVREFINALLDHDAEKTLIMSYDPGIPHLDRPSSCDILIGNRDEDTDHRNWHFEGIFWKRGNYGRVVARADVEEYTTPLQGYVTVRQLINKLLGVDPELYVHFGGNYDKHMTLGRYNKSNLDRQFIVDRNYLWNM